MNEFLSLAVLGILANVYLISEYFRMWRREQECHDSQRLIRRNLNSTFSPVNHRHDRAQISRSDVTVEFINSPPLSLEDPMGW